MALSVLLRSARRSIAALVFLFAGALQAQTPSLAVEVLQTIGQDLELGVLLGGAVAPDGTLLLVDLSNACIWKVDPRTGEGTKIGGPGQGPGEFNRLYRVAVRSDGSVLGYDLASGEVSRFDSAGRFVSRVRLSVAFRQVGSFIAIGDKLYLTGSAFRAGPLSDSAVHVFDAEMRYERSFANAPQFDDARKLEYLGTGFLSAGADNTLIFVHRDAYVIDLYRRDGKRARSVDVPVRLKGRVSDGIKISDTDGRLSVRSEAAGIESPAPAVVFAKGAILASRILDRQMVFDLIGSNGALLGSSPSMAPIGILGPGPDLGTYWVTASVEDVPVVQLIRVSHVH